MSNTDGRDDDGGEVSLEGAVRQAQVGGVSAWTMAVGGGLGGRQARRRRRRGANGPSLFGTSVYLIA